MDGPVLLRPDLAGLVDRMPEHVHDAPEVFGPTGTEMASPVFSTWTPR